MEYEKIYNSICQRGQTNRNLGSYVERHHIIPRCMGGTNDETNITTLTYREHFIVHSLLVRIHKEHRGVNYAFLCMLRKQPTGQRFLTSRMVDSIKRDYARYKKLYCTLENPGKSQKSREAARKRMTERNPTTLNPGKNRTAQPIRVHFNDGRCEDYSYAKEYCLTSGVPYATMKHMLKHNVGCKKHNINRIERI
jgi:5-methylcytosine-specific restriction endonuclease McrA